jgi:hypothetical protein
MKLPRLPAAIDEGFLAHRQRSTSWAAYAGALVAGGLYYWRYFVDGVIRLDLLCVLAAMVAAKLAVLAYLRFTD